LTETVGQAGTTTSLSASPGTTVYGQPVSFVATVAPVSSGSGTLTGSVVFAVDGANQAPVPVNAAGQAGITLTTLSAGATHSIVAVYTSDPSFAGSTSNTVGQPVVKVGTSMVITAPSNTFVLGQPVTFTATVTANSPSTAVPVGFVTFVVDGVNQPPA